LEDLDPADGAEPRAIAVISVEIAG